MTRNSTLNRISKFILVLFGIWPDIPYVLLCRAFWVITIAFIEFCHYRYIVTHIYSAELMDLMDCLSTILAHAKVILKCFIFWINHEKFVEILVMMSDDWTDCGNSEIGIREMTGKAKISDHVVNLLVGLQTATIVSYSLVIILADADVNDCMELPFINKLEVPFNIGTQNAYRFILVMEFLHMVMCGWSASITNVLLLTFVLHAAGQIDILCSWLVQPIDETKHESLVITTRKIIEKHQKVIGFSESIENLYTYIALVQFVSNTIMICLLGFLIIVAIGSPNAVEQIARSLLFYVLTSLEAFTFCFAGEYLSNKSKTIGAAAYDTLWYDSTPKNNYVILFMILRSQKTLSLTAGKLMTLSLQSFTSIMNASGSYISMLLAMQ